MALPIILWSVFGLISALNIWLFKKPATGGGIFGSIPFIAYVIIGLVLSVIIRSRR